MFLHSQYMSKIATNEYINSRYVYKNAKPNQLFGASAILLCLAPAFSFALRYIGSVMLGCISSAGTAYIC